MPNNVSVGTRVTGVGKSSSELDRLRDKFDKLQKQGAKGFAIGAGAAITAKGLSVLDSALASTVDFMGDSISKASDLNETMAKSGKVFGDQADEVEAWGDTTADTLGLSKQSAIAAAAGFGDLFNKMDETKGASLQMSTGLVKLSADLASFHSLAGGSTEALEKLRAGLAGEAEPLRSVGVFLSEAKVQAKAAALGFKEVNGRFTEGAKIAARYALIMEETASAQGDFADTSDELANTQRRANAALEDAQAQLGQKLIPIMTKATEAGIDLIGMVTALADAVDGVGASAESGGSALDALIGAADDAGLRFGMLSDFVKEAADSASGAEGSLRSLTGNGFAGMNDARDRTLALGNAIEGVADKSEKTYERVHKSFQDIVDDFEDTKDRLTTLGEQAADAIYDPIIAAGELAATEREIAEQKQIIASKNSTKEQVRDAKLRLAELNKKRIELMSELTAYGKLSKAQQIDFINELKKKYASGTASQRAAINLLIGQLKSLWTWQDRVNDNAFDSSSHRRASTGGRRASGGPVEAFRPYIVGEQGQELFVPRQDGTIINASETSRIMQGGSSGGTYGGGPMGLTLNVTVNAGIGTTPGAAREIGEAVGPAIYEWGVRRGVWG
jgi:hypothetical protein